MSVVCLYIGLFAVNTYSTQFYNIFFVTILYKKVKQYFRRCQNVSAVQNLEGLKIELEL